MISIGIDPGMGGGIVKMSSTRPDIQKWKMPREIEDLRKLLEELTHPHEIQRNTPFVIEKIPYFIPGKNIMGSQLAKLAGNERYILGYLHAMGANTIHVAPRRWQMSFDKIAVTSSRKVGKGWKKFLQQVACEHLQLDAKELPQWASDAALLALYGIGQANKV